MKIDVEGSELLVMQGARRLLCEPIAAPVPALRARGHGTHFGITPAQVPRFLNEVGYRIHLLDGRLTSWDSDEQPPTPNVSRAATSRPSGRRLGSPGGAPATSPVRVDVITRAHVSRSGAAARHDEAAQRAAASFPLVKAGVLARHPGRQPDDPSLAGYRCPAHPPRHVAATAAGYAAEHPAGGVTVARWPAPRSSSDRSPSASRPAPAFAAHRREEVAPTSLPPSATDGAIDHYAAVIAEDDTLLFDLSPYYGVRRPTQHPVFLRGRLPEVSEVPGSVGVLTTRGSENYYHFLTDVLPRLELLRRAGAEPDAFLVNRRTRFQRDLLDGSASRRTDASAATSIRTCGPTSS